MKILIACEFSGTVRNAFSALGHDVTSCDLLPCETPGKHYQGDVTNILDEGWDLMVAHPPCTYITVSGLHWNKRRPERALETEKALEFVSILLNAPIPQIALENPVGCISTRIRKPDQIIQPYDFGHSASKKTCLWLKNLPPLEHTTYADPRWVCCGIPLAEGVGKYGCPCCNGDKKPLPRWDNQTDSGQNKLGPSADRWALRSLTYPGIANAMASQWG